MASRDQMGRSLPEDMTGKQVAQGMLSSVKAAKNTEGIVGKLVSKADSAKQTAEAIKSAFSGVAKQVFGSEEAKTREILKALVTQTNQNQRSLRKIESSGSTLLKVATSGHSLSVHDHHASKFLERMMKYMERLSKEMARGGSRKGGKSYRYDDYDDRTRARGKNKGMMDRLDRHWQPQRGGVMEQVFKRLNMKGTKNVRKKGGEMISDAFFGDDWSNDSTNRKNVNFRKRARRSSRSGSSRSSRPPGAGGGSGRSGGGGRRGGGGGRPPGARGGGGGGGGRPPGARSSSRSGSGRSGRLATAATTVGRAVAATGLIGKALNAIADQIDKLQPANFMRDRLPGVNFGTAFNLRTFQEQVGQHRNASSAEFHQLMARNSGTVGSMERGGFSPIGNNYARNNNAYDRSFYRAAMNQDSNFDRHGRTPEEMQRIRANLANQGIRTQREQIRLADQAGQLATRTGLSVESTAEELGTWNRHLGMSVNQTSTLMRSMSQVSTQTGVIGQNLLQAVQSARQFSEAMRNAGNFTDAGARNLMQMQAVSARNNTTAMTDPLMQAMISPSAFQNANHQQRNLLFQAAQRGGANQELLMSGGMPNDPEQMRLMASGMRSIQLDILSRSGVQLPQNALQMTPRELERWMSTNLTHQQRTSVNLASQEQTGMEIGALGRVADTMNFGSMTSEQQIAENRRRLNNPNLSVGDRRELQREIGRLEVSARQETMNTAMTALNNRQSGSAITDPDRQNVRTVLGTLQTEINRLAENDPRRNTLQTQLNALNAQAGGANTSEQMNQLVDSLEQFTQDVGTTSTLFGQDARSRQENERNSSEAEVRRRLATSLEAIQANLPTWIDAMNVRFGTASGAIRNPLTSGLPLLAGGGTGAGVPITGGANPGWFDQGSWSRSFLNFATFGVTSGVKDGGLISFANGGPVRGRGGPRSDSILARVSNGEYVVNSNATSRNRGLLDSINSGSGGGSIQSILNMLGITRGGGVNSVVSSDAASNYERMTSADRSSMNEAIKDNTSNTVEELKRTNQLLEQILGSSKNNTPGTERQGRLPNTNPANFNHLPKS